MRQWPSTLMHWFAWGAINFHVRMFAFTSCKVEVVHAIQYTGRGLETQRLSNDVVLEAAFGLLLGRVLAIRGGCRRWLAPAPHGAGMLQQQGPSPSRRGCGSRGPSPIGAAAAAEAQPQLAWQQTAAAAQIGAGPVLLWPRRLGMVPCCRSHADWGWALAAAAAPIGVGPVLLQPRRWELGLCCCGRTYWGWARAGTNMYKGLMIDGT